MKRYLLLLIMVIIPTSAAIQACPESGSVFVAPQQTSMPEAYYRFYAASDVSYDDFLAYGNTQQSDQIGPGDELCLSRIPATRQSVEVDKHDNLWSLWQMYGTLRGFTFERFVRYNFEQAGFTVSRDFNAFQANRDYTPLIDYLDTAVLDDSFDSSYRKSLGGNNSQVLDMLSLDASKHIEAIGADLDRLVDSQDQTEITDLLQYYQDEDLNIKFIIYRPALFENASISVGTIAHILFRQQYPSLEDDKHYILVTIVHGTVLTVTYPSDSEMDVDGYFDTVIVQGTRDLQDGIDLSQLIKDMSLDFYVHMNDVS